MSLDWGEVELEFFGLGRLKLFYFDELLPIFEDSKIDEKATEFRRNLEGEFRSRAIVEGWSSEIEDDELADYLHDQTADFYHDQEILKKDFAAVVCVQITRLLERLIRRLMTPFAAKDDVLLSPIKEVFGKYGSVGINVYALPSYKRIEALWLVNNVYKHGEGNSKVQLKKVRPDLFEKDHVEGEMLAVEQAHIRDFFDGAQSFAQELIEAVKQMAARRRTGYRD